MEVSLGKIGQPSKDTMSSKVLELWLSSVGGEVALETTSTAKSFLQGSWGIYTLHL